MWPNNYSFLNPKSGLGAAQQQEAHELLRGLIASERYFIMRNPHDEVSRFPLLRVDFGCALPVFKSVSDLDAYATSYFAANTTEDPDDYEVLEVQPSDLASVWRMSLEWAATAWTPVICVEGRSRVENAADSYYLAICHPVKASSRGPATVIAVAWQPAVDQGRHGERQGGP